MPEGRKLSSKPPQSVAEFRRMRRRAPRALRSEQRGRDSSGNEMSSCYMPPGIAFGSDQRMPPLLVISPVYPTNRFLRSSSIAWHQIGGPQVVEDASQTAVRRRKVTRE